MNANSKKIKLMDNTVNEILDILKNLKIKQSDYNKIDIVLNYDSCYYEGDIPGIAITIPEKLL